MNPLDPIRMAILDDYHNLSAPLVSGLEFPSLSIDVFKDTLAPHNKTALIERLKPYTILCTMRERTPLPTDLIQQLPNLRLVLTTSTRNASFDLQALKSAGVTVAGTTTSTGKAATTQHTWALILALANNIPRDDVVLKKTGGWQGQLPLSTTLTGLTFASLGLGNLGAAAAKIAVQAFGMRVIAWSASLTQEKADVASEEAGQPKGTFEVVGSKAELFERADLLSVHYVLSERSRDMVGREELSKLKKSALFVNTSRGPLVDEDALFEALDKGKISGAALDVWWEEPLPQESKWRSTKWGKDGRSQVVMAPHTGYVATATMDEWWKQTEENLVRWLKGEEVVNRMA